MFSGVVNGDIQKFIETSSRHTRATTRQQSENSIHKQLTAFERLLQHAMSRYSNENLYHVLRQVVKWVETDNKPASKVAFKLRSVNQLRDIMDAMNKKLKSKSVEDEHILRHYELFLNDLLYLKDLKKYFDDEIHNELLKYHHDSTLEENIQTRSDHETKKYKGKSEDNDSGHGSQAETDDGKQLRNSYGTRRRKRRTDFCDGLTVSETKFKQTVNELHSILEKWEGLLSENILNLNDFDPDSYHELMQFTNYSQFETILRMIPDMFAKCYKCIDLAKTWLKTSNVVLNIVENSSPAPTKSESRQTTTYFLKQVENLQFQIGNMNKSIGEDVKQLEKYNQEMSVFIGRDQRSTTVSSKFNKIDSMIAITAGNYQKSKTEQYAVASKLRSCPKDSPTYAKLKSHLQQLDDEVAQSHWKMKTLEFEKSTAQKDYLIEMEVRPSFIHFVGDTKQRIQEVELFLEAKKKEKLKLEKQLALLKTNEEHMRNIMRPYIGSASTNSDKGNTARESTKVSIASELSVSVIRDGNEADDDSPDLDDSYNTSNSVTKHTSPVHYTKQKPKIIRDLDLRPVSEKLGNDALRFQAKSKQPVSNVKFQYKGPRSALKTRPRREWEEV